MLRHATIPLARAWNTWSSRPAEMVFLPLGVRLTPVLYADSTKRASLFPAGDPGLRLGRHAVDASLVELDLSLAGTRLAWSYGKPDPFTVVGAWRAVELGEWGLRFWVNLCLSSEEGHVVRFDPAARSALVKVGHRFVALVAGSDPVQVTGHASLQAVAADYEAHGYFDLGSRSAAAPVLALRFNLEMQPQGRFAAAVADRADLARDLAEAALRLGAPDARLPCQAGRFAGALDAVRDVTAWNTVWDEINARPYTSISRNWNLSKFGGYGVWLNDQQYAAVLAGQLDPELARENLAAAMASATPQGNLACLLTANDAWVDRTQLPLGAFLLWLLYLQSGSRPLLQSAYQTLARNHGWWWANRDPQRRGLVSYGTSDVGEGLYKGTSFGARNESSMDNAPIHDEAVYDVETRTLSSIDVGLNSLLALDAEMLGRIAESLGDPAAARAYSGEAEALRGRIRAELWDDSRGIFANRLRSGEFVRSVGPTSFYPLICGAPDADQTARLVAHLDDPQMFGGRFVLPGVARSDPAYPDNTYWRGRVWPPLNYLVWHGLRRAGLDARASQLAEAGFAMFRRAWDERRLCPENFNAETGEPLDQPDTEGFYNWGALLPLLAVAEATDFSPWRGWSIVNDGQPMRLGPLQSPVGPVLLAIEGDVLTLSRHGGEPPTAEPLSAELLATNIAGRFTWLRFEATAIAFHMPLAMQAGGKVWLRNVAPEAVLSVHSGSAAMAWSPGEHGIVLDIAGDQAGASVLVTLRPETSAGC